MRSRFATFSAETPWTSSKYSGYRSEAMGCSGRSGSLVCSQNQYSSWLVISKRPGHSAWGQVSFFLVIFMSRRSMVKLHSGQRRFTFVPFVAGLWERVQMTSWRSSLFRFVLSSRAREFVRISAASLL